MTLLTSVFAAIIATVIWYKNAPENTMREGILCWMYWGASLMWFVDAVVEYWEFGADIFTPKPEAMLNDFFLGLAVVALGLLVWLALLLYKDPKGVIRQLLFRKR